MNTDLLVNIPIFILPLPLIKPFSPTENSFSVPAPPPPYVDCHCHNWAVIRADVRVCSFVLFHQHALHRIPRPCASPWSALMTCFAAFVVGVISVVLLPLFALHFYLCSVALLHIKTFALSFFQVKIKSYIFYFFEEPLVTLNPCRFSALFDAAAVLVWQISLQELGSSRKYSVFILGTVCQTEIR